MRDKLLHECGAVQENCTYTAETHHIIANRHKCLSAWFQIAPAIVSALLGVLVGTGTVPRWFIWLSVLSAVVAAVGNILNPMKEYYDHLNASKYFTCLKHDARALKETFFAGMTDGELYTATHSLHERYNDLVRVSPPTDNESFNKASERVRQGVHTLDNAS